LRDSFKIHQELRKRLLKSVFILVLMLPIAACVPKEITTQENPHQVKQGQVTLGEMDDAFLYLAAQDAINHGKIDLAIRFLDTLVKKDPLAHAPHLQLAELLLLKGQFSQAKQHGDSILADTSISGQIRTRTHMLLAKIFASQGELINALRETDFLLKEHPDLLSAHLLKIRILIRNRDIKAARNSVREALKQSPSPEIYRLLAQIHLREGELDQAEKVLKTLIRMAPNDERAVLMLSNLAIRQGNPAKAEIILTNFLQHHPGSFGISEHLGQILMQQHHIDEAIKVYRGLATATGEQGAILTTLGLLYYQKEDFQEAARIFREALAQQPEQNSNRFYLAASLEALGKDQEASEIYERFGPGDKDYPKTQLRLAGIAVRQNRLEPAAQRLTRLLHQHPDLLDAYIMQSAIRLKQKKFRILLRESEPALGLKELPPAILFNRSVAYEAIKDYSSMETTLRRLLAIQPNNAEALNFLGYTLARRGLQLDEAEGMIQKALKQKPGDPYYLDSLAWVYFQQARYVKALELQRKAIKKLSGDPVMTEHFGDILWKTGDAEGARKAWRKAIKLGHEHPKTLHEKITNGI